MAPLTHAAVVRFLSTPIPDVALSRIRGNAPSEVKARAVTWLNFYHAPPQCFAGAVARRTVVTEVSVDPNPIDELSARVLTMVCETDVADGKIFPMSSGCQYEHRIQVLLIGRRRSATPSSWL
jgi:hypothetical protein